MRAVLLASLVTALACQPATVPGQQSANTGVPAGWHVVTNRTSVSVADVTKTVATGFRIGLPVDWDTRELDTDVAAAHYRAWAVENPAAAAGSSESAYVAALVANTKLLAAPADGSVEAPVELHIFARWIDAAVTLDRLISDTTRSYQTSRGATWRFGIRTKIGDHEAYLLRMQEPPSAPGKVIAITSYLLTREREVWMLEFLGPLDQMDRWEPIFDEIASTFRLL